MAGETGLVLLPALTRNERSCLVANMPGKILSGLSRLEVLDSAPKRSLTAAAGLDRPSLSSMMAPAISMEAAIDSGKLILEP